MQFARFGIFIVASLFVINGSALALESDYNDSLKAQLKAEDTPVSPPKKVVRKRIRKADQSSKVAAQKKAMAKNVKVAQTESNVSHINIEPVQAKQVQAATAGTAKEESLEAPSLGDSAVQAPQTSAAPQAATGPAPYQPIFILQPQPAGQVPVAAAAPVAGPQVQPTTNVDAAAVPEPRSDQLRRQREDLEHQTESKLIEKLEDDRLNSEKERADRILKPAAAPTPAATAAPLAAAPVVGPVVVTELAEPAPVPAVPAVVPASGVAATAAPAPSTVPQVTAAPVAAPEAADSMQGESKTKAEAAPVVKEEEDHKFSIGALGGVPSYPTASNVTSYYAVGALATYRFAEKFSLQTTFDYSKYDIKNVYYCPFCYGGTLIKGMDQYDLALGVNYSPVNFGIVSPVIGVVVDYARRNYYDRVTYGYTYGTPTGSNAFNAGLMAGIDLKLSSNLSLGTQFSYLWNISYWTDDPLAYGLYGPIYGSPVETLSYYLATLNLKFVF